MTWLHDSTDPIGTIRVIHKDSAGLTVTSELLEDAVTMWSEFDEAMKAAQAEALWSLNESAQNGHIGPLHRPGRREKWNAELPMRKRNALRMQMQMYRMMSGKRPGRFVRAQVAKP